jgi:acetyl-CoA C-acetyltransferase
MTSQVVFAEPVRTAIGTFAGSLKDVPATALGSAAIAAAVARAELRPEEIETVVMGNVVQAGNKMNPARQAAVRAGLPVTTPALTVNRVCGSKIGMPATNLASYPSTRCTKRRPPAGMSWTNSG